VQLRSLAAILGLLQRHPMAFLQSAPPEVNVAETIRATDVAGATAGPSPDEIQRLIDLRNSARKTKNFAESDRIRKELLDANIILEDGPKGTIWRRG